jgi:hypothetical protein
MPNCADESIDCKVARAVYDSLAGFKVETESRINLLSGQTNNANNTGTALGTLAAAAGVVLMASNPVGWAAFAVGAIVTIAGSAGAGFFAGKAIAKDQQLTEAREQCADLLKRMLEERYKAKSACQNEDCVPPIPSACP